MSDNLKFLKGNSTSLLNKSKNDLEKNSFYLTTDTNDFYYTDDNNNLIRFGANPSQTIKEIHSYYSITTNEAPSIYPPPSSDWSNTPPEYTEGDQIYSVSCIIYMNGDFIYSDVHELITREEIDEICGGLVDNIIGEVGNYAPFIVNITGDEQNGFNSSASYDKIVSEINKGREIFCVIQNEDIDIYGLYIPLKGHFEEGSTNPYLFFTTQYGTDLVEIYIEKNVDAADVYLYQNYISINDQTWTGWGPIDFTTSINTMIEKKIPKIDSSLSSSSTNPVQNKIINSAINSLKDHLVYYVEGKTTTSAGVWEGTSSQIPQALKTGLKVAFRVGVKGISSGTTLKINGIGPYPVKRNASTSVTTTYPVNSILFLTLVKEDSDTYYWKTADYDSDTKTRSSNKVNSKMYIIGAGTQSESGQTTYSNKNCYIGADNCLYSNNEKTLTEEGSDEYINNLIDNQLHSFSPYKTSVKQYGAVGDGKTDDTTAFEQALEENRLVYVPEGDYIISRTLTVKENCELELSQSTVLRFTQTSENCIVLMQLASLKGNHATIIVPDKFNANVILASTREEANKVISLTKERIGEEVYNSLTGTDLTNQLAVTYKALIPPFKHNDPQWRRSCYITDINICKPNGSNLHRSIDGTTSGTAIRMECFIDYIKWLWGVSMSGLRIAGGFDYGIHIQNEPSSKYEAWNHDMRVEAVIEGCKIGVCAEYCNIPHLAITFQPALASGNSQAYVENGIVLKYCKWVDLSSCFIWDWQYARTDKEQFKPIAMYGDCPGLLLTYPDFYKNPFNINDFIYSETQSNLDNMKLLQDDVDKRFRTKERELFYYDGTDEEKIIKQSDMDIYFKTGISKNFTDILPDVGYEDGYIASNGEFKTTSYNYCIATGFIPCGEKANGQMPKIYAAGMSFTKENVDNRVVFYDANFAYVMHINRGNIIANSSSFFDYEETNNGFSIIPNSTINGKSVAYARFSIAYSDWSNEAMLSIDNPIEATVSGYLADGIKVKAENIEGLDNDNGDNDIDLSNLKITPEQTTFINIPSGEVVLEPLFDNVRGSYRENIAFDESTGAELSSYTNNIYLEPKQFSVGDIVRIRGIDWTDRSRRASIYIYNKSNGSFKTGYNMSARINNSSSGTSPNTDFDYQWDDTTKTLTITFRLTSGGSNWASSMLYAFGGGYADGYNANNIIVTLNTPIEYDEKLIGKEKTLIDEIKVKVENVILTSPNGTEYILSISNDGILSTTKITT